MERLNDEQLVSATLAGDMAALAKLVERYHQPLIGYLYRLVGCDWELAQDLAQETFLRILTRPTAHSEHAFKPWLFTVATNLARDHFKSGAVRSTLYGDYSLDEWPIDTTDDPETRAIESEQQRDLIAALKTLSIEYRAALWLRFYSGFSLQEIATALAIPLGTVKSRLSTGLRQLRQVMERSGVSTAQEKAPL